MANESITMTRSAYGDWRVNTQLSSMDAADEISVYGGPIDGAMESLAISSDGNTVQPNIEAEQGGNRTLFYAQDTAAQQINSGPDGTAYYSDTGALIITVGGTASGNTLDISMICRGRSRGA